LPQVWQVIACQRAGVTALSPSRHPSQGQRATPRQTAL
jgi:hypothetical protein